MSDAGPADPSGSERPSALLRAKEIFLRVRVLPATQRASQLDALCGDDADVRKIVEQLLAGEDAPLPFETLADEVIAARDAMARQSESGIAEEQPGTRIGPYRVLEKIGEGGFGVVYMAEQEQPLRRRVALKILKLGMDTRQIVARFEAERQALAIMDHPGIARVFDAGATRTGRPYFVMELVSGEPITTYCDQRSLSIHQRLALFRLVCDAVQHAHQKGVIHRDLKPGNILVADIDGRPAPKIIDFGIAKAIATPLTSRTLFTECRQLIGTPVYMSPEQAGAGDGADIDTRADIYSLGVMLYELLAGTTPFDADRLLSAAYGEMQRIIREEDAPRPSARLSALRTLPSVAARRTIEPVRLTSTLRGELDWVVMKCLDKDRSRRYGSAADLAGDLARYLENQPVTARPASRAYTMRKFIRRHRVGVAFSVAAALLLLVGVAGTAVGLVSALRANRRLDVALSDARTHRDLAKAAERRATTNLARSEKLADFLRSMLKSANPAVTLERDTTVLRELLDKAVSRIDAGELKDQPIVEAEMRGAIADTFKSIGDNTAALRVMEPALRLADAAPLEDHPAYLPARIAAAALLTEWQRNDEAAVQLDRIDQVRRSAGLPEDATTALLAINRATLLVRAGRYDEALAMYGRAREINERVSGRYSPNVASTIANTAGLLTNMGRKDEALEHYREAISIFEAVRPPPLMHLAILKNNAAGLLNEFDRHEEAAGMARESLDICARIFKPNHQQTGMSWHTLGTALSGLNRPEEARVAFTRATDILIAAFNDQHPFVIQCRLSLAKELVDLGRFAEAERTLLAAFESCRALPESENEDHSAARRECAAGFVSLYLEWDKVEPGGGIAQKADRWRSLADTPPRSSTPK